MRRLLLLATALLGCQGAPSRVEVLAADDVPPGSIEPEASCVPAVAEKLGVPFVRVCPRATVGRGAPVRSFWISVIPLGCSAGEHGTLSCPPTTSLLLPPRELPELRAPSPKLAAVVDAYTAHKVCTMRFAGRLPSRAERAQARAALGLASVVVSDAGGAHPVHVRELAEWVTARPCAHPTDLAPECGEARYPTGAISAVPWAMLARCGARPVRGSGLSPIDLGGECVPTREAGGAPRLPCFVRGRAFATYGAAPSAFDGFELTCEPPAPGAEHPPVVRPDVAAFRCVLPEWV